MFRKKKELSIKDVFALLEKIKKENADIKKELDETRKTRIDCFSKFTIKRYNPFSDIGGDQSFSFAMLDGRDTGFIITSLLAKDGNRVYIKPIKKAKSEHVLSDEEKQILEQAVKYGR